MSNVISEEFTAELSALINRHSVENGSNTPDFLLALYLTECLETWNKAIRAREQWYGREHGIIGNPKWDNPAPSPTCTSGIAPDRFCQLPANHCGLHQHGSELWSSRVARFLRPNPDPTAHLGSETAQQAAPSEESATSEATTTTQDCSNNPNSPERRNYS